MKERIDILLVEGGFFPTREKAKRAVMAGIVFANEERIDKPGEKVARDKVLRVKGRDCPYVSRGGYKLEKALNTFEIDLHDAVVVDIGASTGGFTDCALQHGAKLVYAIDVGTNQLVWSMRSHPQVISIEKCNFRYATTDLFEQDKPNFAVIDVSFISLRLILPPLLDILENGDKVVALIKPQFEAGREMVGKKGIVRERKVHVQVIRDLFTYFSNQNWQVNGLTFSPITGGSGNIEFLVYLEKTEAGSALATTVNIDNVVDEAYQSFKE
ncbi:TlyA family RNA methyltransferase [Culicoidibacter larvae]|uniref:TlyA family RNA methyltransferase n=1 Tax=Culicoidibacter larvae TaxID=2579976 RepID=A0A5R8QCC4_9FIRM|nr:TlyA family RNA methyltransferase [Culicoidibacter larvae]TLG74219.1 TlyA family RNA methyltransferase [Culicoidibacter larvae]